MRHRPSQGLSAKEIAAEMMSQILGVLADRARGALNADGANVDILVEWALADIADELT